MPRLRVPYLPETALVTVLALAAYAYFWHVVPYDNANTRWDLTRAWVELGTCSIDAFHENTGDKAEYQGHYYCDKAPGSSLAAAVVYAPLYHVARWSGSTIDEQVARYWSRLLSVSLLSALAAGLLTLAARQLGLSRTWAIVLGLSYAVASPAWPYATLLYGHQLAAAGTLLAVLLTTSPLLKTSPRSRWLALAGGIAAGLAVLTEYPVIIVPATLLVMLLCQKLWRPAAWFVAGTVPGAVLLMVYQYAAFGSPLSMGYQHGTNNAYTHVYGQGFLGLSLPTFERLGYLLVDPGAGLFFSAPLLVLLCYWPWHLWRTGKPDARTGISLAISLLMVVLMASFAGAKGGWETGPRYLLPVLPLMYLALASLFASWQTAEESKWAKFSRLALPASIGVSFVSALRMFAATATSPHVPQPFDYPMAQFWQPLAEAGYTAENLGQLLGLRGVAMFVPLLLFFVFALAGFAGWYWFVERKQGSHAQDHPTWRATAWRVAPMTGTLFASVAVTCALLAVEWKLPGVKESQRLVELRTEVLRDLAAAYYQRDDFVRSASVLQGALAQGEPDAKLHYLLGKAYAAGQQPNLAVAAYREALRLSPRYAIAANELAWVLATATSPEVRDAQESVKLALFACQATGHQHPLALDTLAAALAESGRFDEAQSTAQRALYYANTERPWAGKDVRDSELAKQIEKRIASYQAGTPYRGTRR